MVRVLITDLTNKDGSNIHIYFVITWKAKKQIAFCGFVNDVRLKKIR